MATLPRSFGLHVDRIEFLFLLQDQMKVRNV
jgi:hypothetical protein